MSEVSELLELVDIGSWMETEGVDFKERFGSSGLQLNVKECPVCGNTAWKVYLNAESGLGNCFAGDHPPGEGFNKWSFIRAHFADTSNRGVIDRIKQFALTAGWRPKRKSVPVRPVGEAWQLPKSIAMPYMGKVIPYLSNRGFGPDIAGYFHWRYAPQQSWFGKQNFSYRIILPVFDIDGNLKTFQGRDVTGKSDSKYLFPAGLPASGAYLYNGMNVRNTNRVVVGEGVFDVAAIKLAMDEDQSLRDVVPIGTFGKHLSEGPGSQLEQFAMLKDRGVTEVTFMWDGEIRATDDAIDAGNRLRAIGFQVRIAVLPHDKDPNEVPPAQVREAFYRGVPLTLASGNYLRLLTRAGRAKI